MVRDFEDQLREVGTSPAMVRKIRTALSMLLADSQERGLVNRNVASELRRGRERKADRRQKGKLKIGVDIPAPDEIRAIIGKLGDLLWPESVRTSRAALAGHRFRRQRTPCAPAGRPLSHHRPTEVRSR
jgi:hypothetical protein